MKVYLLFVCLIIVFNKNESKDGTIAENNVQSENKTHKVKHNYTRQLSIDELIDLILEEGIKRINSTNSTEWLRDFNEFLLKQELEFTTKKVNAWNWTTEAENKTNGNATSSSTDKNKVDNKEPFSIPMIISIPVISFAIVAFAVVMLIYKLRIQEESNRRKLRTNKEENQKIDL